MSSAIQRQGPALLWDGEWRHVHCSIMYPNMVLTYAGTSEGKLVCLEGAQWQLAHFNGEMSLQLKPSGGSQDTLCMAFSNSDTCQSWIQTIRNEVLTKSRSDTNSAEASELSPMIRSPLSVLTNTIMSSARPDAKVPIMMKRNATATRPFVVSIKSPSSKLFQRRSIILAYPFLNIYEDLEKCSGTPSETILVRGCSHEVLPIPCSLPPPPVDNCGEPVEAMYCVKLRLHSSPPAIVVIGFDSQEFLNEWTSALGKFETGITEQPTTPRAQEVAPPRAPQSPTTSAVQAHLWEHKYKQEAQRRSDEAQLRKLIEKEADSLRGATNARETQLKSALQALHDQVASLQAALKDSSDGNSILKDTVQDLEAANKEHANHIAVLSDRVQHSEGLLRDTNSRLAFETQRRRDLEHQSATMTVEVTDLRCQLQESDVILKRLEDAADGEHKRRIAAEKALRDFHNEAARFKAATEETQRTLEQNAALKAQLQDERERRNEASERTAALEETVQFLQEQLQSEAQKRTSLEVMVAKTENQSKEWSDKLQLEKSKRRAAEEKCTEALGQAEHHKSTWIANVETNEKLEEQTKQLELQLQAAHGQRLNLEKIIAQLNTAVHSLREELACERTKRQTLQQHLQDLRAQWTAKWVNTAQAEHEWGKRFTSHEARGRAQQRKAAAFLLAANNRRAVGAIFGQWVGGVLALRATRSERRQEALVGLCVRANRRAKLLECHDKWKAFALVKKGEFVADHFRGIAERMAWQLAAVLERQTLLNTLSVGYNRWRVWATAARRENTRARPSVLDMSCIWESRPRDQSSDSQREERAAVIRSRSFRPEVKRCTEATESTFSSILPRSPIARSEETVQGSEHSGSSDHYTPRVLDFTDSSHMAFNCDLEQMMRSATPPPRCVRPAGPYREPRSVSPELDMRVSQTFIDDVDNSTLSSDTTLASGPARRRLSAPPGARHRGPDVQPLPRRSSLKCITPNAPVPTRRPAFAAARPGGESRLPPGHTPHPHPREVLHVPRTPASSQSAPHSQPSVQTIGPQDNWSTPAPQRTLCALLAELHEEMKLAELYSTKSEERHSHERNIQSLHQSIEYYLNTMPGVG